MKEAHAPNFNAGVEKERESLKDLVVNLQMSKD